MNRRIDVEGRYHRVYCYVCDTFGPWYETTEDRDNSQAWHLYNKHIDVWVGLIGEIRPPNVPDPRDRIVYGKPGELPHDR